MPILVERKLFTTGDSLAVTLPKPWVNYFRLKAGDSVEVIANGEVVIRIKKSEENTDLYKDLTA